MNGCSYVMQRVSIHRPHTRPDECKKIGVTFISKFQFTGLIRGPTGSSNAFHFNGMRFNSQASYEARRDGKK